jgi:hypothetical protein
VLQARSIGETSPNIVEMVKYKWWIYKGCVQNVLPMAGTSHRHSNFLLQLGCRVTGRDLVDLLLIEILEI